MNNQGGDEMELILIDDHDEVVVVVEDFEL